MRDFTLNIYKNLLAELIKANYKFMTFAEFVQEPNKKEKAIILRHDVDKKPLSSLRTAELENELGIKGTYYFRVEKDELPVEVIQRIAKMGHEIGYHYDDLNESRGNLEKALDSFQKNLAKLRELTLVKTACMHGSPLSRYDNRDLWEKYDYHDFGIIGEPYFDLDFSKTLYLTDTGRMWDGDKFSIRDRARVQKSKNSNQKENISRGAVCDPPALPLHSTVDILNALKEDRFPNKIMLTVHPQRWTDNYFHWLQELLWQKFKNLIKYIKLKRMEKTA